MTSPDAKPTSQAESQEPRARCSGRVHKKSAAADMRHARLALTHSPGSSPVSWVDPQDRGRPCRQIDEAAVTADFPATKQPGQQGQGVLRRGDSTSG